MHLTLSFSLNPFHFFLTALNYLLGEDLKDATLPIVLRFENGKERAKYILEHGEESYEVQGKSTLYREIRKAGDADKGEVTLIIKKSDAMENLVIVDYHDFRRRPSEQMMTMLKQKYLASHDTVLLNVVAANSLDFLSAHSLTMLNEEMLDKMLLVITCYEDSPSNTLEMVKDSYYWNPGLGVAFIRHKSRKENHSLAVHKEKELFRTHRDLSLIDKSIVGIPQLVHKLGSIQSVLLANCLPRMCRSLDDRLNKSIVKLDSLAPPTSLLVAFLKALSPFIQNTLSPFLDFNHDDPSHPKCLLKLLNQSRVTSMRLCFVTLIIRVIKLKMIFKSKFILAFENHYDDDLLTSISKAAYYAVKLQKKKHTRSLLEFLEGEKMARYKSDT
ncbi:dynamin-related protein 4C-like protein [Tanacetum coccineum]|uniref:Dynamin-related protein 4C-like protein n=1 Tax=Tanacetum coccineum TaxID=301880 RepID=A0ABQ4YIA2_9ASTR